LPGGGSEKPVNEVSFHQFDKLLVAQRLRRITIEGSKQKPKTMVKHQTPNTKHAERKGRKTLPKLYRFFTKNLFWPFIRTWACLEKTDTEIEDISYLVVLVFEVNG
jgi:hypothetical protein